MKILIIKMKAKKVYESIDFERGKDPKEVMGIGREDSRIINKLDTIAKNMGFSKEEPTDDERDHFLIARSPMENILVKWVRERGPRKYPDYSKYGAGSYTSYNKLERTIFRRRYPQVVYLLKMVEDQPEWSDDSPYGIYWMAGSLRGDTGIHNFNSKDKWENIFGGSTIKESASFQRGKDPKKKLGLGAWENLGEGSIIELVSQEGFDSKNRANTSLGTQYEIVRIEDNYYGGVEFKWFHLNPIRDSVGKPISSKGTTDWNMSKEFFYTHFRVIEL